MNQRQLVYWLTCFWLWGCSQQPDTLQKKNSHPQPTVMELTKEIAETSGLACLSDQSFLTINDSGNAATLFRLDSQGRIIGRIDTNVSNDDWEALAIHQNKLWIGDIGNNSGQRATLRLYHGQLPNQPTDSIKFSAHEMTYPQAPKQEPSFYQHELDAEALVSNGEELLLFTKNWTGLQSHVYQVDTDASHTKLKLVGETSALPGLITDAAFSKQYEVFVVVGYQNFRLNPLQFMLSGDFSPFLAILDREFRLVKSTSIDSEGQVEAVCIDEAHNIWLSQEKSSHQPAKFWRWGVLDSFLRTTD